MNTTWKFIRSNHVFRVYRRRLIPNGSRLRHRQVVLWPCRQPRFCRGLLVFLGLLLIAGCSSEKTASVSATKKNTREYPSQEGWNSTYRITKLGKPQAVVTYGHMRQYEKQRMTYFDEGVRVDFYDENGAHSSVLTSEKGSLNEETEDVFGTGNVVIVSDTGVTVYTEKIRWHERRGKIECDTLATIIEQDGDTLYCRGFESNPDLSKIVFLKPWGNSQRRVDFYKIEEDLVRPPERDSLEIEADSTVGDPAESDSLVSDSLNNPVGSLGPTAKAVDPMETVERQLPINSADTGENKPGPADKRGSTTKGQDR